MRRGAMPVQLGYTMHVKFNVDWRWQGQRTNQPTVANTAQYGTGVPTATQRANSRGLFGGD